MTNLELLPANTLMGVVTLKVGNLKTMTDYYINGVGLQQITETSNSILLGENGIPVLNLEYAPELKHAPEGSAGLFHTAILFKAPQRLAQSVYTLLTKYGQSFTGAADHLVSRAFYFDDPEGNGVELYVDYPRETWERFSKHGVRMDTLALDVNKFLVENLDEKHLEDAPLHVRQNFQVNKQLHNKLEGTQNVVSALTPTQGDSVVGHVHLKVGNITTARNFYSNILGFDVTMEFGPQAIFFSAGGYHHHVGANTWYSNGAGPRTPALGLGQVSLILPVSEDLDILREKLVHNKIQIETPEENTLLFNDPWLNKITVKVAQ